MGASNRHHHWEVMVIQTNIAAFAIQVKKIPIQGTCQDRVWQWIRQNEPCTRQMVAEGTGLPINNVCGRVYELLDMGLIEAYKPTEGGNEILEVLEW